MSWTHVILKSQVNLEQVHFGVCSVLTLLQWGSFPGHKRKQKSLQLEQKEALHVFYIISFPLLSQLYLYSLYTLSPLSIKISRNLKL